MRCTGIAAGPAGRPRRRTVLPLQDTSGRRYWDATDPWGGIATRTGHRERLLLLPGGNELLVTASYVRAERLGPVDRVVLALRDTESRRRAETDHAGLISTVAHELRSPLTSVKGFSSTLLRRWDRFTDEQKQLMLQTIEADADRVTRLITELLDISRIDAGRLEVRRQPVDLAAAVAGKWTGWWPAAARRRWFVVDVGAGLPEVWVDPDRLEQMLANLLENDGATARHRPEPWRRRDPRLRPERDRRRERRRGGRRHPRGPAAGVQQVLARRAPRRHRARAVRRARAGRGARRQDQGRPPASGGAVFRVTLPAAPRNTWPEAGAQCRLPNATTRPMTHALARTTRAAVK